MNNFDMVLMAEKKYAKFFDGRIRSGCKVWTSVTQKV